eukprot:TRINITY_DN7505_c0_g1_i1.p1 TRINITY_DN7505_c0_g1~~TRINITY_DN7505_c0_g1_i1.p1  ORF type:complete len:319 (-),score=33.02 TRINITY_DN7505_c0_g1_i1:769-1725(-)
MGNVVAVSEEGLRDFYPIPDHYTSVQDIYQDLQEQGLEQSKIILGLDFSLNNMQGKSNRQSLHTITDGKPNLYEEVLALLGKMLKGFNEDGQLPVYGFGDRSTEDKLVFPFMNGDEQLEGFDSVIDRYRWLAPSIELYGPTSFAPLLIRSTQLVEQSGLYYHMLIIIASGSFDPLLIEENKRALIHASKYPLSIVFIGIGEAVWHGVEYFDNKVHHRVFDNFQFVDYTHLKQEKERRGWTQERFEKEFALRVLMEVPEQFKLIQKLHLMNPEMRTCTIEEALAQKEKEALLAAEREEKEAQQTKEQMENEKKNEPDMQ